MKKNIILTAIILMVAAVFLIFFYSLRDPIYIFLRKIKRTLLPSTNNTRRLNNSIRYWINDPPEKYYTQIAIPDSKDFLVAVYKQRHILQLVKNRKIVKEYRCNVRNELPDRLLENDGQTPEGIFKVYELEIITYPAWKRWIAFDTSEKAKGIYKKEYAEGIQLLESYEKKHGVIDKDSEIRKFNEKHPDNPMLRGFGIHGGGYNPDMDWTLGCPALNDLDVIELYNFIKKNPDNGIGTLVIIQD